MGIQPDCPKETERVTGKSFLALWGTGVAKSIKKITNAARGLRELEEQGKSVSAMFDVDCDYRCLFVSHNYLFYRIEKDKVIIVQMFDEREEFMQKLFGISTIDQENIDYWNE